MTTKNFARVILRITLGLREVEFSLVKRSGTELENQIWRNHELSDFSLNSCYFSRRLKGGERSGVEERSGVSF